MNACTGRRSERRARIGRAVLVAGWLATAGAAPAAGAVYWVGPAGSDARDGRSPASAWATTARANAALRPGDVCRFLPGSYDPIAPAASGEPGARITYVGDVTRPERVKVAGSIGIERSHVTVKGVSTTTGGLWFAGTAAFDSIAWCAMDAPSHGVGFSYGHDNVMVGCRIVGDVLSMDAQNPDHPGTALEPTRNVFRGNSFTGRFCKFQANQACVVDSNRFSLALDPGIPDDQHFRAHYVNRYNTFRDNHWDLTNRTGTVRYALHVRDSSEFNRWVRDTIVQNPASTADIKCMFATSGAYQLVRYNTYDGLFVKVGDVAWQYQAPARRDSVVNCVLVSTGRANAFQCDGPAADSLVFVHNTVATLGGAPTRGVFVQDGTAATNRVVRHNVFYSAATSRRDNAPLVFHGPRPVAGNDHDHNLYFSPAGDGSAAAVKVRFDFSPVGSGTTWSRQASAPDRASRWGDPMFSVPGAAGFDPTPRPGSAALGAQWPDGYVGAIAASLHPEPRSVPASSKAHHPAGLEHHDIIARTAWSGPAPVAADAPSTER